MTVSFRLHLSLGLVALSMAHCQGTPSGSRAQLVKSKSLVEHSLLPLRRGQSAPDFEGLCQTGFKIRASQFSDPPLAVHFCVALDTTCEQEARAIRDQWSKHKADLSIVIQITPGTLAQHRALSSDNALPQLLVSDGDGSLARSFGLDRPMKTGWFFLIGKDRKILASVATGSDATSHAPDPLTKLFAEFTSQSRATELPPRP